MTRRNTPLEVEQVEQLALIARLLPHHGESPSLISQADGITVRRFSRALFQQHRPNSDIGTRRPGVGICGLIALLSPFLGRSVHSGRSFSFGVLRWRHTFQAVGVVKKLGFIFRWGSLL